MKKAIQEKRISQFLRLSILLKGLHAALEIIGGLLLFFLSPSQLTQYITWITHDKLVEDPENLFANFLLQKATALSVSSIQFGAYYLLGHGLPKLILVISLLKKRLWAYPWSLAIFSLFVIYQIYRMTFTHSIGLFLLTVFDLIVIWLIWREYKIVRKRHVF